MRAVYIIHLIPHKRDNINNRLIVLILSTHVQSFSMPQTSVFVHLVIAVGTKIDGPFLVAYFHAKTDFSGYCDFSIVA